MGKSAEALLAGISKHSHARHVGVLYCTEGFSCLWRRRLSRNGRWMQAFLSKNCPAEGSCTPVP